MNGADARRRRAKRRRKKRSHDRPIIGAAQALVDLRREYVTVRNAAHARAILNAGTSQTEICGKGNDEDWIGITPRRDAVKAVVNKELLSRAFHDSLFPEVVITPNGGFTFAVDPAKDAE